MFGHGYFHFPQYNHIGLEGLYVQRLGFTC